MIGQHFKNNGAPMLETSNKILSPFQLKHLSLKNRAVVAPMSRVSTKADGVPTAAMIEYYNRFAEGNFSLIITEGTYTDRTFSQAYPNQPGLTNELQIEAWRPLVSCVKQSGSSIILQLMHAGALTQHLTDTRSASDVQPLRSMLAGYSEKQGPYPQPHAMSLNEIENVKLGFIETAKRAEQIGFDGVEVHAANGYLLDQFLTDYTNRREDCYGGSLLNRVRLSSEIIHDIQREVSDEFVVGIRLSQGKVNDFDYLWPGGVDDGDVIFKAVQQAGVDYIHFASEGLGFDHGCLTRSGESLPKLASSLTQLPIIANGGLETISEATRILSDGHGDLISLGKGAIANPDWPQKIAAGETIEPFDPEFFVDGVAL
jgi:2,4-dienoyl-CoA reductase-like NADH-dependent reductase (Old Yellow Enzyme family)